MSQTADRTGQTDRETDRHATQQSDGIGARANRFANCGSKTKSKNEMRRRNAHVKKSMESVLRPEECLYLLKRYADPVYAIGIQSVSLSDKLYSASSQCLDGAA